MFHQIITFSDLYSIFWKENYTLIMKRIKKTVMFLKILWPKQLIDFLTYGIMLLKMKEAIIWIESVIDYLKMKTFFPIK